METQRPPNEPADLRQHQPVERGLYKLTAMASTVLAITTLLAWGLLYPHFTAQLSTETSICYVGLFLAWALVAVKFLHDPFADFVRKYWEKNVRGYVVAYTTYNYGGSRTGFTDPFPRGSARATELTKRFHFVVLWPLGGWFARPKAFWRGQRSKWAVTPIDGHHPTTPVRVTDGFGSSLRFATLKDATDILAVQLEIARSKPHVLDGATDMPFSWLQILSGLSEQRDEVQRRLDLLSIGRDEVHRERDEAKRLADESANELKRTNMTALEFLQQTVNAIDNSSRLKDSLEGLLILRQLLNEVIKRYEAVQLVHAAEHQRARLAVIDAKIAEKQKRERRRHGKGATSAAT